MLNWFQSGVMDYDTLYKARVGSQYDLNGEIVEKVANLTRQDGVGFIRMRRLKDNTLFDFGFGSTWASGTWSKF